MATSLHISPEALKKVSGTFSDTGVEISHWSIEKVPDTFFGIACLGCVLLFFQADVLHRLARLLLPGSMHAD